jgi:hypothetical protein
MLESKLENVHRCQLKKSYVVIFFTKSREAIFYQRLASARPVKKFCYKRKSRRKDMKSDLLGGLFMTPV